MGQRANLLLIEGGKQSLYYSHWRANSLDTDLFWGPDYATSFIRIQREIDESGWLDDVWAEGGAVVDHDSKVLLFFGGEDVLYDIPLRRVYLQLLGRVWQGWKIQWAYEGIADIADYTGYPRSKVLSGNYDRSCSLRAPEEKNWTDAVASIRFVDGAQLFYPLAGLVESQLGCGPEILQECDDNEGYTSLLLDEWVGDSFPTGGFCIDVDRRQLDYWIAHEIPGDPEQIARAWSGWTVTWQRDAYETQLAAGGGQLRFPTPSAEALREKVTSALLSYSPHSPVDLILRFAEKDRQEGKNVQINPWALRDDRLDIPTEDRRRIIASALGIESLD